MYKAAPESQPGQTVSIKVWWWVARWREADPGGSQELVGVGGVLLVITPGFVQLLSCAFCMCAFSQ